MIRVNENIYNYDSLNLSSYSRVFFPQETNREPLGIQEKSLPYVLGEQFLRPFIDRIQGLASRFFKLPIYFRALDKYLSFPVAEAAYVEIPPETLKGIIDSFQKEFNIYKDYRNAKQEEALRNFQNAMDNVIGRVNFLESVLQAKNSEIRAKNFEINDQDFEIAQLNEKLEASIKQNKKLLDENKQLEATISSLRKLAITQRAEEDVRVAREGLAELDKSEL